MNDENLFLRERLQEAEAILYALQHHNATKADLALRAHAYFAKARPNFHANLLKLVLPIWVSKKTHAALRAGAERSRTGISDYALDLMTEGLHNRGQRERRKMERERLAA